MADRTQTEQPWKPAVNPWLIAASVMLATFMEVLDTSVANVSLNYIAGSLAVSNDEATWVLTSYLVANAVVLPASGWLSRTFGRKRFLITCIAIFTLASVLCGVANSLGALVLARILQGAGGGALQPVAQAVMLETFPREKRGVAMSVYAMGVVVAPILGPTLGGWLTDNYSWRWVFYINLPIGILAILMCIRFLEDPPYLKNLKAGRIDFWGIGFLALWIGCLQVMLDKGQDDDWFSSHFIRWLAVFAVVGFILFLARELQAPNPIVNLRVLKDRNLAIGVILNLSVGAVLYATTAVIPRFLQLLLGYTSYEAGLVMSPRGIGAVIGSIVAGRVLLKLDGRLWMAQGAVVLGLTMFLLGGIDLDISPANIIWPIIISGFALTSLFVPMSTFSVATMKRENMGDAAGLTSSGKEPRWICRDIVDHGAGDAQHPSTPGPDGRTFLPVCRAVPASTRYPTDLARCGIGSSCSLASLRRFVPNSSTAGRLVGLRGTVPPAGADLLGAGTDHLPIQEGGGDTAGRGDGALISKDFRDDLSDEALLTRSGHR